MDLQVTTAILHFALQFLICSLFFYFLFISCVILVLFDIIFSLKLPKWKAKTSLSFSEVQLQAVLLLRWNCQFYLGNLLKSFGYYFSQMAIAFSEVYCRSKISDSKEKFKHMSQKKMHRKKKTTEELQCFLETSQRFQRIICWWWTWARKTANGI